MCAGLQDRTRARDRHAGWRLSAINAFDTDAIVATFAADALVYDVQREFWGVDEIRAWVAKELVGDRVTIEVTEEMTIVHVR